MNNRRTSLVVLLLLLMFLVSVFGASTTFNSTIAARWSLPCTSSSSLYNPDSNSACRLSPSAQVSSYLSTAVSITWGVGVYGTAYASTLTFDPYDSVILKLYSNDVASSAVPIGVLTHYNYPINCYDDCNKYIPTNFDLALYVNILVGSDKASYAGVFTMYLDETANVDGRDPLTDPCPYDPLEKSWVTYVSGGYNSAYPCCPYYTAKAVPSGGISINGPCSDRLTFTTVANFNTFTIQGTKYTLVIAGFSSSATSFNADVTFFTSQENQSQTAYIWAYVTRKCTDSSACDDNQQCTNNVCNTTTGLCEYPAVTNGLTCTDPKSSTYYSDVCTKFKCKTGTCYGSILAEDGSCVNSAARPSGKNTDCSRSVCKSGICTWSNWRSGSVCTTGLSYTDQQCQRKICVSGSCHLGSANGGQTCTPASTTAQAALAASSSCNSAVCVASSSGTCRYSAVTGGSCTQVSTAVCNKRLCKSKVVSSLTVGTCQGTATGVSGSCQSTGTTNLPSATVCKQRLCVSNSGVGSCRVSSSADGGSCVSGNGALTTAVACKARTCSSGVCSYAVNNNQGSCVNSALTKAECWKTKCNAGTCGLTINTAQGSCTNSALTKKECYKLNCNSATGNCESVINTAQGSCTNSALTKKECYKLNCNSATGNCESVINSAQGSCTNSALTKKECYKLNCNSATGNCESVVNSAQGSCSGPAWQECYKRTCVSGVCTSSIVTTVQGSCFSLTARYCYKRLCSTTTGQCGSSFAAAGGSCAGARTITACQKRVCNSRGTCIGSANNAEGSCSTGVATSKKACYKRICNAGTCNYTPSGQGSCQVNSAGASVSAVVCKKRVCSTGSCVYQTNDGGSCTIDSTGAAVATRDCKKRLCSSGSCRFSENTVSGGSCSSSWVGNTQTAVSIVFCNKRNCDAKGTCQYVANPSETSGSCQTLTYKECYKRKCKSTTKSPPGSCGYLGTTAGSCVGIGARQECKIRQCQSDSTCNYNTDNNGGSCVGTFTSSSYSGMSAACTKRVCSSGVCTFSTNNLAGTCNTGKTSNDYTCFKQRCHTKTGFSGGTCSTSASATTKSCTAGGVYSDTECRIARCDGTGSCKYNYNSYGTSVTCTSLTNNVCALERCNGQGTCVYRSDLKEGTTGCLATDATTVYCTDSKCVSGACVDVSDVTKNASTICKTSSAGEDTCKNYYCLYMNPSSTSNKLGTCMRLKDPSMVGQVCSSSAYSSASTEDSRCFALSCDSSGVCQQKNKADGTYCATPPNTATNNGYGCAQYVCKSGTCNTAAAVPITNGTTCAGWLPCDPSTASCLSECQRFVCYNGECQVDYFNENNNCTYIKYLTARDGAEQVARDSEDSTTTECTQGICKQGRCVAQTVENGTSCGNRTKYNDLCYGDYCNAQGQCVHTGRRNCVGVLSLPSVCWDATCEASSGDCVLKANGVVDCSCIFDCSACTAKAGEGGRELACYWCTGDSSKNTNAGCFNRRLPGQTGADTLPPTGYGKCYADSSPCASGNSLSGGQVAGIVVGVLGLSSLAALAVALMVLAVRYFAAASVPPANASLTDLAFDKNVKNNVFYKGANLEMFSSVYAEPKFITT